MSHDPLSSVFVVSAPSGTGKTTLNRRLVKEFPDQVEISVSLTTRKKRPGETEGVDYHYVSEGQFHAAVSRNEMLEWALVHGNLYGTSLKELEAIALRNRRAILEIDVQGWENARKRLNAATSVFILPPSMQVLWERLKGRGTDDLSTRQRRIRNARDEIAAAQHYHYFIINDDLEAAYQALRSMIIDRKPGKIGASQGAELVQKLMAEFDSAEFQDATKS
jgi:guanylate kinase